MKSFNLLDHLPNSDDQPVLKNHQFFNCLFYSQNIFKKKGLKNYLLLFCCALWSIFAIAQAPPPPGLDEANSSATLEINGFPGEIELAGPTIIQRGEAFTNSEGLIEIPLEMKAMCLEGMHPVLGAVRVQAGSNYGLPPTFGTIKQMDPDSAFFPVESSFNIFPKVEVGGMGSFCSTDSVLLEAVDPITSLPPYGIEYVPPGGSSATVQFIDCCSGDTFNLIIHVGHTLETPDPPVPNIMTTTSTITIADTAAADGVVELNLVLPNDCNSVIIPSGNVAVSSGQSAAQTANDLGQALANQLALQPACDIEVSVGGGQITIVQRVLTTYDCCLIGTDIIGGVILANQTLINLSQEFNKNENIETVPDLRCTAFGGTIPTLSQWGLILFTLLLLTLSTVAILRRQTVLAGAGGGNVYSNTKSKLPLFDPQLYWKTLPKVLLFVPVVLLLFYLAYGFVTTADVFGTLISAGIISYMIHYVLLAHGSVSSSE